MQIIQEMNSEQYKNIMQIKTDDIKRSFDSIDITKFIASILIFAMHCEVLKCYGDAYIISEVLARWGVPFFFLCSSYFLFSKSINGNIDGNTLKKYIFRILRLYKFWFVINLPNVIYTRLYMYGISNIDTWLVFLKKMVLASTFTGSWYLTSSIFSAWFVYTISKKIDTKKVVALTSIIYVIGVLSSIYSGVLPYNTANILKALCFPLNIFCGCFYFALGKLIYEHKQTFIHIFSKKKSIALIIVFFLLFITEIYISKKLNIHGGTDMAFSLFAIATAVFALCLQSNISIKKGLLLRKMSTIIYCGQGNVLLLKIILGRFVKLSSIVMFIISLLVMLVVCVVVIIIQDKTKWKIKKYMT